MLGGGDTESVRGRMECCQALGVRVVGCIRIKADGTGYNVVNACDDFADRVVAVGRLARHSSPLPLRSTVRFTGTARRGGTRPAPL
jgi:hypothetical protein